MYIFMPGYLIGRANAVGAEVHDVISYKTFFASLVTIWVIFIATLSYKRKPWLAIILLCGLTFSHLVFGMRSAFLISLGTLILCLIKIKMDKKLTNKIVLLIAILLLAYGGKCIYEYSVTEGLLGEDELVKYLGQSQSSIGLLSGRAGFIAASAAIKDSPILGHGSWAIDEFGEYGYLMAQKTGEDAGYWKRYRMTGADIIPGHSYIWNSWIWHGALGGFFWIYTLFFTIRFLLKGGLYFIPALLPYVASQATQLMWDIPFSPISIRPPIAAGLAILIIIFDLSKRSIQPHTASQYKTVEC